MVPSGSSCELKPICGKTPLSRPLSHFPSLLSKTTIRCLYTNAQCLTNKITELTELCTQYLPQLVAVTETWFQPHISDSELDIRDMSLFRRDRMTPGGGVALYYSRQILCKEITDDDLLLQDTLWCSVRMVTGEDCIVGVIYRPPSASESFNHKLLQQIRLVASRYRKNILIMGDFNLPNLLRNHTHPVNSLDSDFHELLQDLPLYNHVLNHTRYRGMDTPSLLDLILTSEETVIESIVYDTPLGLSDHMVLIYDYVCQAERASDAHKTVRKVNRAELSNAFQNITDWSRECNDVHQYWSILLGKTHR